MWCRRDTTTRKKRTQTKKLTRNRQRLWASFVKQNVQTKTRSKRSDIWLIWNTGQSTEHIHRERIRHTKLQNHKHRSEKRSQAVRQRTAENARTTQSEQRQASTCKSGVTSVRKIMGCAFIQGHKNDNKKKHEADIDYGLGLSVQPTNCMPLSDITQLGVNTRQATRKSSN